MLVSSQKLLASSKAACYTCRVMPFTEPYALQQYGTCVFLWLPGGLTCSCRAPRALPKVPLCMNLLQTMLGLLAPLASIATSLHMQNKLFTPCSFSAPIHNASGT
eukprot:4487289-Amphidinium_carterae.1